MMASKKQTKTRPKHKTAKKAATKSPVEMARAGDIEGLWRLADCDPSSDGDAEAYKWLCAAEDFGHDTDDRLGDVLELTSLRYDDDGYVQAYAHWELAQGYLSGTDGLPFDLALAESQLKFACRLLGSEALLDGNAVLGELKGEARALLATFL